jgi:D-alanyl-D-alanine carboxypeptidase
MTAQIGEGNGYGTMEELNKHIRTLMKGENVLKPATIQLMQKDVSAANTTYGLGCSHTENLGYGHNGARLGFLNSMNYDPDHDVSVIVMIPLYDFRNGNASFSICFNSLLEAAYAAREVLGYPGKP